MSETISKERFEFLDQEIENYENNMFMKAYGDQIQTGIPHEWDHDWEERLSNYMESIYEEFNKNCIDGENFRCENCGRQYEHKLGHEVYGETEGWNHDHHNFEWSVYCCWYCCKQDKYGGCEHY